MRTLLSILALAASLSAETPKPAPAEAPLSKESAFELQLLVNQERTATEKLQAVAELLITPIREAKEAAMQRACALAGIPMLGADGRPACEIDLKEGKVRRIAPRSQKEN